MAQAFTLCVGTIGTGLWRSTDSGATWGQARTGLWTESRVFSLAVHPHDPHILYAGADSGMYKSEDGGGRFKRLESSLNDLAVWKVAIDPRHPQRLFAGTRPAALYRSEDGGVHWEALAVDMVDECPAVRIPRVTSLVVDPQESDVVWAGIEVDGVRRSLDGGNTWTRITSGIDNPDIHDMAVSAAATTTVITSTQEELFVSTDKGHTWRGLGVEKHFALPYCRGLALRTDNPQIIFVATGDSAMGGTGAIQRSQDGGHSWERLPLPIEPNTPIWAFATHPAEPRRIAACSHYGQVFVSEDGGDTWQKLHREFSEIRSLAWMPH